MNPFKNSTVITVLSVALPLVVALLFSVKLDGYDFSYLPSIYATINGVTAVLLVAALVAIKMKKRLLHERLMIVNLILSSIFLVMYVLYHITSDPTSYCGTGFIRIVYYFILITHIILSVAVTPLVLFTLSRALQGQFDRHRRLAKITFPIWLYIAVTGVVVYLMISPFYGLPAEACKAFSK